MFDKLPTILVLAVLVGIFLALRRYVKSPRLNLWTVAWGLILLHFVADWFPIAGNTPRFIWILSQGSLQLSSIFFIASLTSFFENRKLTGGLVALFALPMMTYTMGLAYDYDSRFLYIACSAVLFFGLPVFVGVVGRLTFISLVWVVPVVVTGAVAILGSWRHQYDFGFLALLTLGFGLPAFLYLRRYPRWSSGVITSAGGFLLWGGVFPLAYFVYTHFQNVKINPELWNTPKFFVAFGMIMTLLEDKSRFLSAAQKRERKANEQMQKFAGITSRLLSGVDLNLVSREIAEAICETSTFSRVCIVLSSDGKKLYPAGYAGMDASAIAQVEANCAASWNMDDVIAIFREGEKLGQASRLIRAQQVAKYNLPPSAATYPPDPRWQNGDRVFVPLQSTRGAYVGCISMDDPRDLARVNGEEVAKIELLAGDLAVTVDNASLHRQLVRSEKLAAIGQLVAGVAHELNNPLASIVGYSELMTDDIKEGPPRQKLDKMIREAQRMKRIIENLLRFARQNNLEKKSTNLETLLQDVLALREYHIRNHAVELKIHVESGLPLVAVDEDQFKQILLNLLNNSIDALEGQREKKIQIRASLRGDRVLLHFDDNGPGFRDPNRVFDPFYTTKPVGKGTGLGLSICYGIVKEHGGEIQAANLERGGARVILELPSGTTKALSESPTLP